MLYKEIKITPIEEVTDLEKEIVVNYWKTEKISDKQEFIYEKVFALQEKYNLTQLELNNIRYKFKILVDKPICKVCNEHFFLEVKSRTELREARRLPNICGDCKAKIEEEKNKQRELRNREYLRQQDLIKTQKDLKFQLTQEQAYLRKTSTIKIKINSNIPSFEFMTYMDYDAYDYHKDFGDIREKYCFIIGDKTVKLSEIYNAMKSGIDKLLTDKGITKSKFSDVIQLFEDDREPVIIDLDKVTKTQKQSQNLGLKSIKDIVTNFYDEKDIDKSKNSSNLDNNPYDEPPPF